LWPLVGYHDLCWLNPFHIWCRVDDAYYPPDSLPPPSFLLSSVIEQGGREGGKEDKETRAITKGARAATNGDGTLLHYLSPSFWLVKICV